MHRSRSPAIKERYSTVNLWANLLLKAITSTSQPALYITLGIQYSTFTMIFKSTFLMAGTLFMMGVRADCGTPVVTCETTDGSPDAKDVEDAMGYWRQIAGLGKDTCGDSGCAQPHGSGCHDSSVKSGTANIVLCQDDSSSSTAMCGDCNCIAGYLQAVIDQCENNGKIGGYAHVPMGSNYINYEFVHT